MTPLFKPADRARTSAGSVTFDPGARSNWHTHPLGQTLVVTAGRGWVQEQGGPKQEIKAGDVVRTPPGVKHWHGASANESVTHIAIQEEVDGKAVEWLEPVSNEQYAKGMNDDEQHDVARFNRHLGRGRARHPEHLLSE